jgi:hypothetical protein
MNRSEPSGWAGARAQLHDAARAACQVADDRELPPPFSAAVPMPRTEAALMPAELAPGQQPRHPVRTLTARQLRDYRRDLEHAPMHLPGCAPVSDLLGPQLAEVRAEQDSRAQAASSPGTDQGR